MPCNDLTHVHNATPWPNVGSLILRNASATVASVLRLSGSGYTRSLSSSVTSTRNTSIQFDRLPLIQAGDAVKNARIRQNLYNERRRAAHNEASALPSPSFPWDQTGVDEIVAASPAPGIANFTSSIDRGRVSVGSSMSTIMITDEPTELDEIEIRAPTFGATAVLPAPTLDDSMPFEMPASVEQGTQSEFSPALKRERSTEELQKLSNAALERQRKIMEARLEESRIRLAHSSLILKQMLIEDEQERRKELDD